MAARSLFVSICCSGILACWNFYVCVIALELGFPILAFNNLILAAVNFLFLNYVVILYTLALYVCLDNYSAPVH